MGADKASLVVDGVAMQDRVIQAVRAAGVLPIVVAGGSTRGHAPDVSVVADEVVGQGPLAGVSAAWKHLRRGHGVLAGAVVLSCDLPGLDGDVVARLVGRLGSTVDGVQAHDGERPQPLVAVYRSHVLDHIVASFDEGDRSLRKVVRGFAISTLVADRWAVSDADTPADLDGRSVEWPKNHIDR